VDQDSLRSKVNALLEDRSGRLWCGAYGAGVFYRDLGEPWQPLNRKGPLTQLPIDCLQDDSTGAVWIGLAGGLCRVLPRTVTTLPAEPGLEPNIFLTVCTAHDGSVWGGTDGSGALRWRNGTLTCYSTGQD